MPQMGVSVSEGTITKWLKQPGEAIAQDEPLLEISTDKVDTEIPSPGEGVVAEILVAEGETVEVGTLLAVIAPEGSAVAEPAAAGPHPSPSQQRPSRPRSSRRRRSRARGERSSFGRDPALWCPCSGSGNRVRRAGATGERLGQRTHVHLAGRRPDRRRTRHRPARRDGHGHRRPCDEEGHAGVHRVGRRGRPGRAGTRRAGTRRAGHGGACAGCCRSCARSAAAPVPPAEPPAAPPAPPPAAAPPQPAPVAAAPQPQAGEVEEPMTAMRRGVMEHMRRSLDTSAHVTSAIEVDMSKIVAARARLKQRVPGLVRRQPDVPRVRRPRHGRDAERLSVDQRRDPRREDRHARLGQPRHRGRARGRQGPDRAGDQERSGPEPARHGPSDRRPRHRARTKKLLPDDVQGGTFTITNPGGYGTFHGTPIISQPQVGILGTYALVKRPWVVQDELGQDVIAIRPMMNVTLTYDHRLVDGAYSGGFLRDLRERLEELGRARLDR